MPKIKWILVLLLAVALIYTRFVNLSWGLPYPMHPDERNMANAIQQLKCEISRTNSQKTNKLQITNNKFQIQECFNPHFFAYGQFPLYAGYGIVYLLKFFDGDLGTPISYEEAVISLRIISALSSALNIFVLLKVIKLLSNDVIKNKKNINYSITQLLITGVLFIFSPFFIQFSHFGTTESLLMLLFSSIIYLSVKYGKNLISTPRFLLLTSIFSGLAISIKISSIFFLFVPVVLILDQAKNPPIRRIKRFGLIWYLLSLSLVFTIIFSPHNFISFPEFLGSMNYESDVALGLYRAFYTRQFDLTEPVIFQVMHIFPYVLGWPVLIFFILGFIFLPWKTEYNLLRLAVLTGFLPNAFLYAKWTRFISPILPLMLILSVLFIFKVYDYTYGWIKLNIKYQIAKRHIKYQKFFILLCHFAFCILIFASIFPGIAFFSIYQNPDVRFTASDWIYKNIPNGSYILSETANVVDPPVPNPKSLVLNPKLYENKNYNYISFNFYDLDVNSSLPPELDNHLNSAEYIFIPSRRIFANYYCSPLSFRGSETTEKSSPNFIGTLLRYTRFLAGARNDKEGGARSDIDKEKCLFLRNKYPKLNDYYDKLFSGKLGFQKVAEFTSFPKIELLGTTLLEFPDEKAEETWTVFDHPVLRIYKKN